MYMPTPKTCKLPILYALMQPHSIRDAGFWTKRWKHAGRSPSSLTWRTQHLWFPTRMSKLDSSDHRTLFHFESVHFKWALAHRTWRCFWSMFTYGFLFAWNSFSWHLESLTFLFYSNKKNKKLPNISGIQVVHYIKLGIISTLWIH